MKAYLIMYIEWIRFWLRFRYLCWRHGTDFVFRSMEKNLIEMGATLELDTPEKRVYRLGSGAVTIRKKGK